MGPVKAVKTCISKSFTWKGRASRSEFWWFFAFYNGLAIFLVISIIASSSELDGETEAGPLMTALILVVLGLIPASLAVLSRRIHDKGLTTWLMLLCIIPIGQIILLIFTILPGDVGDNSYGPDPLGRTPPLPEPEPIYAKSSIPRVIDKD